MIEFSRRDLFKTALAAPAAAGAQSGSPAGARGQSQGGAVPQVASPAGRERLLLDFGWTFHFGHAADPAQDFDFRGNFSKTGNFGAVATALFNDSDWKAVDLPHDWAIDLPFTNDSSLSSKGFYPLGRAYPATSIGWYRRIFDLPASDAGRRISIEFDGAYREVCVILNGFYIGRHIGGYDPFSFDVTDFASPGGRNVLVVRVNATESDGWFYEGAGIYRHVWLVKTHPVHVKKWGTFVRSQVAGGAATLKVRTELENHGRAASHARVTSTVLDPSGKVVGKATALPVSIPELGEQELEQQVVVRSPALWSLEKRNLYKLVTEVEAGGAAVDRYETTFGIRTCAFDAQRGFFLNGQSVKLKGTCNHQDHAGLGAALPDSVQYYRVRKLQEMGCNALRTSHNPPTPELLNAADELGMLVFDETRMMSSNPEGLSQLENLVRRDRNHPSVFLWSLGNEEGQAATDKGYLILSAMKEAVRRHDDTRPCSMANNSAGAMGKFGFAALDVQGYNYADPTADAYHKASPTVPVMGTEQVSAVATRGIYIMDPDHGFVGSYDPWTTSGRASCEGWWTFCDARPWMAGGFIWTGFDYRGEPSPYGWPNISSQYGIIDTCGFPKDSFFYFQSWWTAKPVLHVFPHWNWPGLEGQEIAVWVYSNLDRVELFANGQSLGAKDLKKDGHLAWNVKYAPGYIEARGFKDGKLALTERRDTVGTPAQLVLTSDRRTVNADGEDVAMFAVEVRDAQGRYHPLADNQVSFRVSGQGTILGTGNGDPTNHEPDRGASRKAFNGYCMAVVQSTKAAGRITVEAASPGLTPARVTIASTAVTLRPQAAVWQREVPAGEGITGLWRPEPVAAAAGRGGNGGAVYTFRQNGAALTGSVEGAGGRGGAGEAPVAIENGRVDGGAISFTAGGVSYTGAIRGEGIEIQRAAAGGRGGPPAQQQAPAGPRPAIGPPPDGSDPSNFATVAAITGRPAGRGGGGRGAFTAQPVVLRRALR
ncbi:MAG TPA: beta-galactosidase GalA [Bryobacteraceae bacterium]|nr:beta-galactosidase GalA [Bryobacteraceae bacterium]